MFRRYLPLWILLSVFVLALSACLPGLPTPQAEQPGAVETAANSTVSAMVTQAAFETLVAQLTQVSQPASSATQPASAANTQAPTADLSTATTIPTVTLTNTPIPSLTPLPTNTPVPSLTPVPPTAIPLPCYRAQFVSDVSIPDGTTVSPNQTFYKTWRLRNTGSCNWTPDTQLVFVGGNPMGNSGTNYLNATVRPNDVIDITITLTSPSTAGEYTGNYMLRSASGIVFGLGSNGDRNFWVQINVAGSTEPGVWDKNHPLSFAYNYCAAVWKNSDNNLPCPGASNDFTNGSVTFTKSPVLAGGYQDNEPTIVTIPNKGSDGRIVGRYPALRIKSGDSFYALIGCLNNSPDCDVTFEVQYRIKGDTTRVSLGTWEMDYETKFTPIDLNLDSLADEDVEFFLIVNSNGSNHDDRAFWEAVKISR